MITFSGVQMHPGCGHAPTAQDIAVGMCRVSRYAGALWLPLAAHSILVAELSFRAHVYENLVEPDARFCMGLLHDAHEVVTGEITRPYKPPEMKPYEMELDAVIFRDFHLAIGGYWALKTLFKEADEKALTLEATTFGLKDWPNYYRRMEGKEIPTVTAEERQLSAAIFSKWCDPFMVLAGSEQIRTLTKALEFIAQGHRSTGRNALIN